MRFARISSILIMSIIFSDTTIAQYYYKDIISNRQNNSCIIDYRNAKIRQIKILSYEENGEPSKHFFCEKKISKDYTKATLYTKTGIAGKSVLISNYNDRLQLVRTYDSSDISVNESKFYYDNKDRLVKVSSVSKSADDDYLNMVKEEHVYEYTDDSQAPSKMLRIKNNNDTTLVLFSLDDQFNVSIEKDTRTAAKYYYYYDESNRLTDLVHTNEFSENMIADYIFEYDSNGRITRQTSAEDGSNNYLIWRYEYEGNLRKKEKVYSKKGVFIGSIEYNYN